MADKVKIIECPRDAMQGLKDIVPLDLKVHYINALLKVGFDTLDFGSFVSPKAVPQMADTDKVLENIDPDKSDTKLLAIVANKRGAEDALKFEEIDYLGYPFSISETFQQRNTRKSISESMGLVKVIQEMCVRKNRKLVIYISMGFGNPYGDPYSPEIAEKWVSEMAALDISIISLADTVGTADKNTISKLFSNLIPAYPEIEFGAHFHAHPDERVMKLDAAWEAGCRRFDSAIQGYGGCPFAEDELVGNIATETLLEFLAEKGAKTGIKKEAFNEAMLLAGPVFL